MKHLTYIVLLGMALAACGGGGGNQVAGIDRTGNPVAKSAVGTVTGFGSIIVNGVTYNTDNATFTIDGNPGTQSDLNVGDVVVVTGTIDSSGNATATSVVFDDLVEGAISSIDLVGETLTVLGQVVRVGPETSFDDSVPQGSLAGLQIGNIIEVTGFRNAVGEIEATRIELEGPGGDSEVTGIVTNLDTAANTFAIAGLTVDYSAAQLEDFPAAGIAEGDLVEAEGMETPGGVLQATTVEFKDDDFDNDDGDELEVEGFITRFVSATDFDVGAVTVTTNGATVFEGGSASDLGLNIKVEVEGEFDANGILVADKVDIRRAQAVRISALVDSVDGANGSLVMLGITINTDSLTRFEDDVLDQEPFGVADINVGDYIEVRGSEFPAGSGEVLAGRLEREDPDDTVIQGFVASIAEPQFEILGVSVDTTGADFEDENDSPISAAEFFNRLAVGDLVEAEGTEVSDQAVSAREVEFEDD